MLVESGKAGALLACAAFAMLLSSCTDSKDSAAPPFSLSTSTPGLSFTATEDSSPPNQSVIVSDTGEGSMGAPALSDDADWLTTSVLGSGDPYEVVVQVDASTLPTGHYHGTVTIALAGATNSPITLPVSLAVTPRRYAGSTETAAGAATLILEAETQASVDCAKLTNSYVELINGSSADPHDYQASVDAGRMSYASGAVADCLTAIAGATCEQLARRELAACDLVFAGNVANGDACSWNLDCAEGKCDGLTCPRTCTAKAPNGASCQSSVDCISGACNRDSLLCVADVPGTLDQPCGWARDCADGLWCESILTVSSWVRTCRARVARGAACPTGFECPFSDVCLAGTCVPRVPLGESCESAACGYGAYCSASAGTTCVAQPESPGADCAEFGYCFGLVCGATDTCVARTVSAGGACSDAADLYCVDGTYCSSVTHTCQPISGLPPCALP